MRLAAMQAEVTMPKVSDREPPTQRAVDGLLHGLPEERRVAIELVREVVLANLPDGIVEAVDGNFITYEVPLEANPDTYNGKPLRYVAIASQKRYMSLYLMGVYADERLRDQFLAEYKATGKKLDMGASCVRFRRIGDLPLEVVGRAVQG